LPRFNTDLGDEGRAGLPAHLERVGLPSRPVQRDHEEAVEPLPQRMLGEQRPKLPGHVFVAAKLKVEANPLFDRGKARLLKQCCGALDEIALHAVQRGPAPEVQRGVQRRRGVGDLIVCCLPVRGSDQLVELLAVQVLIVEVEQVAR
jgi:hypothetical protein